MDKEFDLTHEIIRAVKDEDFDLAIILLQSWREIKKIKKERKSREEIREGTEEASEKIVG